MGKKTDNSNLQAKLELRRYFLRKYHADSPPSVLDCCQGDGVIWKRLREEFSVASYWGLDMKPRKGRLKIDSVRVLAQSGWPQNVVDIDTYGSQWKHWDALLPNVSQPTTVFLTFAWVVSQAFQTYDLVAMRALGIGKAILERSPKTLLAFATRNAVSSVLTMGCVHAKLIEATEAVSAGKARYIGVRLEPKANGREAATPGRS